MGYDIHPGTVMRSCIDSVTAVHQVYSSMQVSVHMYYNYIQVHVCKNKGNKIHVY